MNTQHTPGTTTSMKMCVFIIGWCLVGIIIKNEHHFFHRKLAPADNPLPPLKGAEGLSKHSDESRWAEKTSSESKKPQENPNTIKRRMPR